MKFFNLCLLCGAMAVAANAQDDEGAKRISGQPAASDVAPNGYETLVEAGKLLLPGENGRLLAPERLTPSENLRRQRLAVARNAPALKTLRRALQMPIHVPPRKNVDDTFSLGGGFNLWEGGTFMELARQLSQESDVRLADGNLKAALDSRLTAFELGVTITRGAGLGNLRIGAGIEAIARQDFEFLASKLDVPTIRAALPRLKATAARRPGYFEVLKIEKSDTIRSLLSTFSLDYGSVGERKLLTTPDALKKSGMTEAEAREWVAMTPKTVETVMTKLFDALIAVHNRSYQSAVKIQDKSNALDHYARFNYEYNRIQTHLLASALELRLIKLKRGAYPATFSAGIDLFSLSNRLLIYKRNGSKYLLYSVGPDGRDDSAKPVHASEVTMEASSISHLEPVNAASKGDIPAPIF